MRVGPGLLGDLVNLSKFIFSGNVLTRNTGISLSGLAAALTLLHISPPVQDKLDITLGIAIVVSLTHGVYVNITRRQ